MRQTLSIALILILYVPYTCLDLAFEAERKTIQREVKRKLMREIPSNELIKLKFSTSQVHHELRWVHAKEFEHKGEMFDIVYQIHEPDSILYICWWDHEETELNKRVKRLAQIRFQIDPNTGKKTKLISHYIHQKYLENEALFIEFTERNASSGKSLFSQIPSITSDFSPTLLIPPEELRFRIIS